MAEDGEEIYLNSDEARAFDFHLLKAGNELFKESDYIIHTVVNVKRVVRKKDKTEDWHIIYGGKVALILKGTRFTVDERSFFRTAEGMQFIVRGYKCGMDSVLKFKNKLKEMVENNS